MVTLGVRVWLGEINREEGGIPAQSLKGGFAQAQRSFGGGEDSQARGCGSAYQYDALGHRIQQTVGGSGYLNDLGAGLPTVLSETNGANVTRFLHGPRGLHQLQTPAGGWQHAFADALGSLRLVTDSAAAVLDSRSYGPYGDGFGQAGPPQTGYGYSGEPADANGLVYDRARYFSPALGQFPSLDPLEVFNRYGYVNGNPVMRTDPSGMVSARTPLMIDVNESYAVVPKSSKTSKTPATGSQIWQPPAWSVAPVTPPPTVQQENVAVQAAFTTVIDTGLTRLTQSCSSTTYRASHPDICNVQTRLFGMDRERRGSVENQEWGLSLDPRFAPQRAVSNGRINPFVLARNMSNVFGYTIGIGDPRSDGTPSNVYRGTADELKILTLNALDANLHTAAYFRDRGAGVDPFGAVRDTIGRTADGRPVTMHLGASQSYTGSTSLYQGRVPFDEPDSDRIFIGPQMDTAGIVHEQGHQIDRRYGGFMGDFDDPRSFRTFALGDNFPDAQALRYRASCDPTDRELVADYFMTDILDGWGYVGGAHPPTDDCPNDRDLGVGWANTNRGAQAETSFNAYTGPILSR